MGGPLKPCLTLSGFAAANVSYLYESGIPFREAEGAGVVGAELPLVAARLIPGVCLLKVVCTSVCARLP